MGWVHTLSRVPVALIVAASAWAPIAPFRPKPLEPLSFSCTASSIATFGGQCYPVDWLRESSRAK